MSFRQNAKSEEDLLLFAFLILPAGLCSRSLLLIYNTLQTMWYKIRILRSAQDDKKETIFTITDKKTVFHTCWQRRDYISHLPTKKRLYFTPADKKEAVFHTCWQTP